MTKQRRNLLKRVASTFVHVSGAVTLLHIASQQLGGFAFNTILLGVLVLILLESTNYNQLLDHADLLKNGLIWAGSDFILWMAIPRMKFESSVVTSSVVLVVMVFIAVVVRKDAAYKGEAVSAKDRALQLVDPMITLGTLTFLLWTFVRGREDNFLSLFEFLRRDGSGEIIEIYKQAEPQLGEALLISGMIVVFCFVMLVTKSGLYLDNLQRQIANSISMWAVVAILLFTAINTGHGMGWLTALFALFVGCVLAQLKAIIAMLDLKSS